ncbi:hypothetical protein BJ742DRAFT_816003 [Cladochytrium replicatum]|nr:hypothetical protein BJ742DRAFT_816003 [Cladochytrium replicatum]
MAAPEDTRAPTWTPRRNTTLSLNANLHSETVTPASPPESLPELKLQQENANMLLSRPPISIQCTSSAPLSPASQGPCASSSPPLSLPVQHSAIASTPPSPKTIAPSPNRSGRSLSNSLPLPPAVAALFPPTRNDVASLHHSRSRTTLASLHSLQRPSERTQSPGRPPSVLEDGRGIPESQAFSPYERTMAWYKGLQYGTGTGLCFGPLSLIMVGVLFTRTVKAFGTNFPYSSARAGGWVGASLGCFIVGILAISIFLYTILRPQQPLCQIHITNPKAVVTTTVFTQWTSSLCDPDLQVAASGLIVLATVEFMSALVLWIAGRIMAKIAQWAESGMGSAGGSARAAEEVVVVV